MVLAFSLMRWIRSLSDLEAAIALLVVLILAGIGLVMTAYALNEFIRGSRR